MYGTLARLTRTNSLIVSYGEKCTGRKFRMRRGRFDLQCRVVYFDRRSGEALRPNGEPCSENRLQNQNFRLIFCTVAQIARAQRAFEIDVGHRFFFYFDTTRKRHSSWMVFEENPFLFCHKRRRKRSSRHGLVVLASGVTAINLAIAITLTPEPWLDGRCRGRAINGGAIPG